MKNFNWFWYANLMAGLGAWMWIFLGDFKTSLILAILSNISLGLYNQFNSETSEAK